MSSPVNIAIVGGSGFWSEQSHHKHLLELRQYQDVTLRAVVDLIDPKNVREHPNLQKLLVADNTAWLNPDGFPDTDSIIRELVDEHGVNLVIIASNPVTHFEYGLSCLENGVNVICDKPIVSTRNASTDSNSAAEIRKQYEQLLASYETAKKQHPHLLFHSVLRRRSLDSFVEVAKELGDVYQKTGAGINNMTVLINGGIYKLPAELTAGGAHGYVDGVGSISHSAYHYIDVIAWFLSKAPGQTTKIYPSLNYVLRVQDYLNSGAFMPIAKLVGTSEESLKVPDLPSEVLGCELNAGFTFMLCNDDDIPTGEVTFLFNHSSFTPRINPYIPAVQEPANRRGGGRVSHFVIDVNQEGLQSWQIEKNDIVFEGNDISVRGRRHPMLDGESRVSKLHANAYEPEVTMKDLLGVIVSAVSEGESIDNHSVIRPLQSERLATELFASCYELLSAHYERPAAFYEAAYIAL